MVKVIINGTETLYQATDFENFGDFLRKLIPEGQVLKTLKINGKDVPIGFVDELKGAKIDEDITIEMELVNAVGFLVETLKDVLGYIEHVKRLLPEVSKNLIMNSESGWRAIKDLADGISAMENLRTSTRQITKLTDEELNMVTNPSQVMEILRNLLSALDSRDNLEVSDVVENKIPIVLNYYIEYFSKVLEALRTTN